MGDERGSDPEAAAKADEEPERVPHPYKLVVSTDRGYNSSSQLRSDQWYFAIDWGAEAAAQYDPGCIEEPQLHDSMRQAKARAAAGPKPYDLDECIEVCAPSDLMANASKQKPSCLPNNMQSRKGTKITLHVSALYFCSFQNA